MQQISKIFLCAIIFFTGTQTQCMSTAIQWLKDSLFSSKPKSKHIHLNKLLQEIDDAKKITDLRNTTVILYDKNAEDQADLYVKRIQEKIQNKFSFENTKIKTQDTIRFDSRMETMHVLSLAPEILTVPTLKLKDLSFGRGHGSSIMPKIAFAMTSNIITSFLFPNIDMEKANKKTEEMINNELEKNEHLVMTAWILYMYLTHFRTYNKSYLIIKIPSCSPLFDHFLKEARKLENSDLAFFGMFPVNMFSPRFSILHLTEDTNVASDAKERKDFILNKDNEKLFDNKSLKIKLQNKELKANKMFL